MNDHSETWKPRLGSEVIDLEFPRTNDMPVLDSHQPGYAYHLYRRHSDTLARQIGPTGRSSSSGVIYMKEHSGTHVDALCHQAEDLKFYGCADLAGSETPEGFLTGDATEIPIFNHPATLLDVGSLFADGEVPAGTLVGRAQLQQCVEEQQTPVRAGSVVFVRTGNGRYWGDSARYQRGPGIHPEASEWLGEQGVAAVGADNLAWDLPGYVDPDVGCDLPGHILLLVRRGIFIFENVALEELARKKVFEFRLFAVPLKLAGATGSPVRPLAILNEG